jgi:hypothetical protein
MMIRHIVFFTLKDAARLDDALTGLSRLGTIPGVDLFEVKPNQKADLYGNDIDIVVYAEFASLDAMHAWKRHPTYGEVTASVRPMRELRFAADIEAGVTTRA